MGRSPGDGREKPCGSSSASSTSTSSVNSASSASSSSSSSHHHHHHHHRVAGRARPWGGLSRSEAARVVISIILVGWLVGAGVWWARVSAQREPSRRQLALQGQLAGISLILVFLGTLVDAGVVEVEVRWW
ncbi:hypothetical protein IWZ03DRAFT_122865, partial [Phyllosticta citriasiana]